MWDDPIVAEVRRIREQLAGEHNFDVHAIFEDMRRRQGKLGEKLVVLERPEQATPSNRNSTPLHPGR